MVSCTTHIEKTWYICKSTDDSIIHPGYVEVGQQVNSGQDEIEIFTVEQDWIDRLVVLGITIEIGEY